MVENKSNKPLVTVMIPVYNREKLISETLECALNQDFDDYEVVMVDNKSTDSTFNILREYSKKCNKLKIFQNEKNIGPVKNWKIGIEKSKGKYIKILWSDDLISKDFLNKTVPILENNNDIGFVYTKTEVFNDTLGNHISFIGNIGESGIYSSKEFIEAHILGSKNVPVSPGNALFRLDDVKESLIINIKNPKKLDFSKYGAGNDLLIYLLIANKYKYFYYLNETLSFFRSHDESFTISNDLKEYYLYSKVFFLENYCKSYYCSKLRDKYYSIISLKKEYRYMIKALDYKFNISFVIWKIFVKIIKRIKNKFNVKK